MACTRDCLPCSSLQASKDATTSCRDDESIRGELETSVAILCRGETFLLLPVTPHPLQKQNKPAVYRSKHEPFMKLPWSTYILKCNQKSTSGSGIPASAA